MWLHIPLECCPRAPESEEWNSESGLFFQQLARCATSRGTWRQPKYWQRAWQTGALIPLQFGLMSAPSTPPLGLIAWISSFAPLRASRSAWPGSVRAKRTSAGYGPTSGAGFGTFDRDSSSWRTFPDLFGMDYPLSSEIWPKRGSLRNGVVLRHRASERPTVESGCSSWPTATVHGNHNRKGLTPTSGDGQAIAAQKWPTPVSHDDNKTPEAHLAMKQRMKGGPRNTITSLQVMAQTWPTPRAEDSEATGAHRGTPDTLTAATKQWQTPTIGGGGQQCELIPHKGHYLRPSGAKATLYLEQQASQWATPTSSPNSNRQTKEPPSQLDGRHGKVLAGQACDFSRRAQPTERDGNDTSPPADRLRLNPRFVEALMGLPDGWTDLPPIETTDYMRWEMLSSLSVRRWLSQRLRTLLDSTSKVRRVV